MTKLHRVDVIADHDDILPARQMGVLVAAGFPRWPSPMRCPAYGALFPDLIDAMERDHERRSPLSYLRFLWACWRCRRAVRRGERT